MWFRQFQGAPSLWLVSHVYHVSKRRRCGTEEIRSSLILPKLCFKIDHLIFLSAVDLKSLKKDKVVPKAGSTSSLKVPTATTENLPSDQGDDSSKKKKVILRSLLFYCRNYFLNWLIIQTYFSRQVGYLPSLLRNENTKMPTLKMNQKKMKTFLL